MNKLMIYTLASVMLLTIGLPSETLAQHHRGHYRGSSPYMRPSSSRHYAPRRPTVIHHSYNRHHSGWSTAGHVLAGVAIGSMLQSTCYAPPPVRREIRSYHTVYHAPTVVREVHVVPSPFSVSETTFSETTIRETVARETIWVQNSNGSETPVELRRDNSGRYIGPKGEYYFSRPSNDQLRMLYGM